MNAQGIERGDWYEDLNGHCPDCNRPHGHCICYDEDIHEAAPVQPDRTDDEWNDWFHTTHNDGTPIKEK